MNAPRKVVLRIRDQAAPAEATLKPDLDPAEVEAMLAHAERLGLPRHEDPAVAALLAAARVRSDIPLELYAALAAVLSRVYAATGRL